ncbi:MAG: serine hydrolase domain-containing protein [Candidatus Aphodocola sp.]
MINIDKLKYNVDVLSKSLDSLNIDSIFVEQNNNIERIFYKKEELHELRSCSKLLVAMAIGIAIENKMFDLDTLVYPVIENIVKIENANNLNKIKKWNIRNLLTHTTGYESQMMSERYIENIDKDNLLEYALNYDIPYEPGKRFAYNNVEPFILSVFFQEKFGINLTDFINENIFKKLNIVNYKWDNYGKYSPGATGLYMRHTDFHKIGQLLLNNGKYNNTQIIPETWIKEMCKMQLETPSAYKPDRVFPKVGIGYYTFISKNSFIFRDGSNGQYIILNKYKDILITIMSSEKDMKNVTEILRNVI